METVLDLASPHVLRTWPEYESAVAEVDRLLDAEPQPLSEEYDRLELLSLLIEDYEARHNPITEAGLTPQDVVDFALEQHGLSRADLAELMGGRSRVSDFFSGKRELSRGQILALRSRFGIPADLLLR
jgi:HTH-type transcriptional regulator / antitoxin HigA